MRGGGGQSEVSHLEELGEVQVAALVMIKHSEESLRYELTCLHVELSGGLSSGLGSPWTELETPVYLFLPRDISHGNGRKQPRSPPRLVQSWSGETQQVLA